MPPTRRQRANLRRGGIQGSSATAARARDAQAAQRAEDETLAAEVEEVAERDPAQVVRLLAAEAFRTALGLYRRFNRSRAASLPPGLVEASREARHLAERVLELDAEAAAAGDAERFFGTLAQRFEEAARGRDLLEAVPLVEPD